MAARQLRFEWFEKLQPGSQFPDAVEGSKTSITLNSEIGERLRAMKNPGQSWDSFFVGLIEEEQRKHTVSLDEGTVQEIADEVTDSAFGDAEIKTIATRIADSVMSRLR